MIDLHIHSLISHDAESSILEYCAKALETGFQEIGFAEHLDLVRIDPHYGFHNYEKYLDEIKTAREKFPGLGIRMGVEVSYLPSEKKAIMEHLGAHDYDFVLGAVHLVEQGATAISEEEGCREYFSKKEAEECYAEFFELGLELVKSGIFDGLAHLDIINRFGSHHAPEWEWRNNYGAIRRIFEGRIKRQMALEINTSGFRQSPGRTYPDRELVRLYRELGGKMICIGSDAHRADDLGSGCRQALSMARKLGFNRVVSFERRQIQWIEIPETKEKVIG